MSSDSLVISSDEDESHQDVNNISNCSSNNDLIINETDPDQSSSCSVPSLPQRRDSELCMKKKQVRVLSSDSEEDENGDSNNQTNILNDSGQTSGIMSKIESSAPQSSQSETSNQESVACIDHSTNTSDVSNKLNNKSNSKQNDIGSSSAHSSKDELNLSTNFRRGRITEEFQFNAAGILNSTAFPDMQKPIMGEIRNICEESSDIVEISSDDELSGASINVNPVKKIVKQQKLESFIVKLEPDPEEIQQLSSDSTEINEVTPTEFEIQKNKVASLEMDCSKLENLLRTINVSALPDGGKLLHQRARLARQKLQEARHELALLTATKEESIPKQDISWGDLEDGANAVQPKTFGKQAMSTYNNQKAVTLDRLQQLHQALKSCPKEEDFAEDPKGLKVELMSHQKRALAWLAYREKEKPSGGILADDMGLGKTLTMISLILSAKAQEKHDDADDEEFIGRSTKFKGGSLIVCPASLLNQWSGEIDRRLKSGLLSYLVYHGPKRETRAKIVAQYDVVITTYSIISVEVGKSTPMSKIKWRRIVLDEAHQIRNPKSKMSDACCQLSAMSRWALTGTPMQNKELDMYALLKYLRCTPFDDLQVWKRWVGDKNTGGVERLHTVISSLMLRRTKAELIERGSLNAMPDKTWELVKIQLDKEEMEVYHKVLIFSQTLFAQFLHQRAERRQDEIDAGFTDSPNDAPNAEYFKMRDKLLKLNKLKNVNQHEILVLLLRLRQICCHPKLITGMLEKGADIGSGDEECEELNILEQLNKLNINNDEDHDNPTNSNTADAQHERVTLKEASKGHLNPSNPIFSAERASSKIKEMLKILQEKILNTDDKAIVVSQWASFLELIEIQLKNFDIQYDHLNGKVPVNKRIGIVDRFNDPKNKMKVLLLSLTAGGVGLNLVGGNHLFLLDLHWNPQLEKQAQDRIYRVGQKKPVFVYKFMAAETIEERIKTLQDRKLNMADGMLTGSKQVVQSKLSLDELKLIFGM